MGAVFQALHSQCVQRLVAAQGLAGHRGAELNVFKGRQLIFQTQCMTEVEQLAFEPRRQINHGNATPMHPPLGQGRQAAEGT